MSDKDKTDEHKIEKQKSPISARKAKKLTKLKEYLSKQESLKNARKVLYLKRIAYFIFPTWRVPRKNRHT